MTAVVTDPGVEACIAIVDRINAPGGNYTLATPAVYVEYLNAELELLNSSDFLVAVVNNETSTLDETLNLEPITFANLDRTTHAIQVWVMTYVLDQDHATIEPLKLFVRSVMQWLFNFDSANGRVRVWDCDLMPIRPWPNFKSTLNQELLRKSNLFAQSIVLRVEVEAPAP